jgi:hypothetical protein
MSELAWLTLAAMALFLALLVPANYLISLLWARDPSNTGVQEPNVVIQSRTDVLTQPYAIHATTHASVPVGGFQQTPKTTASGFDLAAA